MIRTLTINLFGKPIGALYLTNDGYCNFQYTKPFRQSGIQPSPLLMPTGPERIYRFPELSRETFHGLPGMIADSLPDSFGQALLNQWLEANSREPGEANVIEKLSFQGKRCMGALEFIPARDTYLEESSIIELQELEETARIALKSKDSFRTYVEDRHQAILDILKIGTSAGGQRAKAVIAMNDTTGEIRSGQVPAPGGFRYWILKFDGFDSDGKPVEPANFGRREYAFSKCVREAGIDMTECRLLKERGRAHFLTLRFDRTPEKIHSQTLCALAHYDFRQPGAYSYEQCFAVMRRLGLDYKDAEELYRRMVFNVLCANMDDHTKNISFLMDRHGKWSLSPAYDMGFAYNPKGQWANAHQMTINGKRDGIINADLISVANQQGIRNPEQLIEQVAEGLTKFETYSTMEGVPKEETDAILHYMNEKSRDIFTRKSIQVPVTEQTNGLTERQKQNLERLKRFQEAAERTEDKSQKR
jgi:serine/threonine-protein kinase HipA